MTFIIIVHNNSFNVVSPDFQFRISASVVWMGFNMYFCRYVFTFQSCFCLP